MSQPSQSLTFDLERYVNLSLQLSRWVLKPIGAWPQSPNASRISKIVHLLIHTLCHALIGFLLIPSCVYVVHDLKDPAHRLKLSGALSFCLMATLKYYSLTIRDRDIRRCIECIEVDWRNAVQLGDQSAMIKNAMFGRKLIKICAVFMYGGAVFYYLARPLSGGKSFAEDGNFTYRPLVYPVASNLLDARRNPVNEIFFWVQCLAGFLVHSITVGACSLAAVFAMHAYGQLELLMSWLREVVDGRENVCNTVNQRLANIVERHIQILSFISLTENILNEISFVEVVGCTLNMCFLGYSIIMEWESNQPAGQLTYFILLISITFNIFIFCYIGHLLSEQCKKVGEASYMIEWYRLPGRKGLGLILIISMSNHSTKLTAGKLFELSLSSFGDAVKTSVAYLNMCRTLLQ